MNRSVEVGWLFRAIGVIAGAVMAGLLALAGAALIALAGLRRLSPDLDWRGVPRWFWYFRADPQVHRWMMIGLIVVAGALALLAIGVIRARRPPLYGAARWAKEAEIVKAGLRARKGIVLGRKSGRYLIFGGSEHVLLHAPTRTGKGVGIVIPNLLTWPDSVVVLDVKRENWEATAGFRAVHGQRVLLFDPLDPEGRTARYNPLGHIARDDPVVVMDELQKLAVMLFPAPDHADPFWAEASRTGFIGVGAYVAETPELCFSLGQIYQELTTGDPKTRLSDLIRVRRDAGRPLSAGCANALSDFCSSSDNTFASIKQTLSSRLNLWLNPRVCAATDVSDFDLRDLRDQRISLYLGVTPDNLRRIAPLYSLLLQQLVDLNTRERPTIGRHAIEVLVLLDEFARLGQATVIAHAFAYVAGYGLRLLPVLQSPAQLRAEYGADLAEEIIANCGVEVSFAPKEIAIARDLSERMGSWTYPGRSSSRPTLLSQGRRSLTESDQRRSLMLPQELIQMPADRLIIVRAGIPPILGQKIVYWRERAFTTRTTPAPAVSPRRPTNSGYAQETVPNAEAEAANPTGGLPDNDLRMGLPAGLGAAGDARSQTDLKDPMAALVDRHLRASQDRRRQRGGK